MSFPLSSTQKKRQHLTPNTNLQQGGQIPAGREPVERALTLLRLAVTGMSREIPPSAVCHFRLQELKVECEDCSTSEVKRSEVLDGTVDSGYEL